MIEVSEALELIKSTGVAFGTELIPLSNSVGRILKEDWISDRALPPFDRCAMDGIAITYEEFKNGQRVFKIVGLAAAGDPQKEKTINGSCFEVMTGAILPIGYDTVVRYEDLTMDKDQVIINLDLISKNQNIHFKGSDREVGKLVAKKNTIITSAEIGLGASIGKNTVSVARLPSAMVLSTGNELVDIDQNPLSHQIRKSNVYQIGSILYALGISHNIAHLNDAKDEIKSKMKDYLNSYDVILISGGVSKGKFDFLPGVLEELGAEKLFHRVTQRPGKPFWFGKRNNCIIFAFPGNPVSSFVCVHKYFIEWLEQTLGAPLRKRLYATLTDDVNFTPNLTYFLEVKISCNIKGQLLASPQKGNGSGDLANLVEADAIMELTKGKNTYEKGEAYPIYLYK